MCGIEGNRIGSQVHIEAAHSTATLVSPQNFFAEGRVAGAALDRCGWIEIESDDLVELQDVRALVKMVRERIAALA